MLGGSKISWQNLLFRIGKNLEYGQTRPAWAGFKTAEEGRTKIM